MSYYPIVSLYFLQLYKNSLQPNKMWKTLKYPETKKNIKLISKKVKNTNMNVENFQIKTKKGERK